MVVVEHGTMFSTVVRDVLLLPPHNGNGSACTTPLVDSGFPAAVLGKPLFELFQVFAIQTMMPSLRSVLEMYEPTSLFVASCSA
jgi:hypothetical protein